VHECRVNLVPPTQIRLGIARPRLQSCIRPLPVEEHAQLPVCGERVAAAEVGRQRRGQSLALDVGVWDRAPGRLTYLLLVRAFRSLLLPLKAVLLNLVSVAATFGLMVLFWQHGFGSKAIFGIHATGAITFWIPLMVFAFLYGLSMDYEVFITRIREEYDGARSTNAAVIEGIGRTGRLVTSAALILFLAFAALASGPGTDLKVLATGLGFGILLDATIVRSLLVPSLVSLFGRWNWYLPARIAHLLRVQPSHPHPEVERPAVTPVG